MLIHGQNLHAPRGKQRTGPREGQSSEMKRAKYSLYNKNKYNIENIYIFTYSEFA
jgi:hypothetical protein